MRWRYDEDLGTDLATELTFTAQEQTEYDGRRYQPGDDLTITLPHPIDRATLDDMASFTGPWGWGGYTSEQLADLIAGRF